MGGGSPASSLTLGMMSPSSGDLGPMTTDQVQQRGADVSTGAMMIFSRSCVMCSLCVLCDTGQCGTQWGEGVCQQPLVPGPQLARLRRRRTEAAHWWPLSPATGQRAQSAIGWGQQQTLTLTSCHPKSDSHSAMLKQ